MSSRTRKELNEVQKKTGDIDVIIIVHLTQILLYFINYWKNIHNINIMYLKVNIY